MGRPLPEARVARLSEPDRPAAGAGWAEAPGKEEFEGERKKESTTAGRRGCRFAPRVRRSGDPRIGRALPQGREGRWWKKAQRGETGRV